ncbi:hypothetical protein K0M31_019785 [Melipona bicolor]|uniref:Uncharacterized protein n=1 Tax=Melipona bicolor TaxID=60889 RepID=A0AA40G309_9HYME|nr:hypothetical protein K0M31_019785 [Melipona bicolor]
MGGRRRQERETVTLDDEGRQPQPFLPLFLLDFVLNPWLARVRDPGEGDDDRTESGQDFASSYSLLNDLSALQSWITGEIYCTGELLKTVQLAHIFNDSKKFVDLHQLNDPEITLSK